MSGIESELDFGCKLGANCTQFAPNFTDFSSPNHPVTSLECVAGTTGLEPATSALQTLPMKLWYLAWHNPTHLSASGRPMMSSRPPEGSFKVNVRGSAGLTS
jgi:hypothetical protein